MIKNHLLRLTAPKYWPIKRKGITFITRTRSGPHKLRESIPLNLILKEILKHAFTSREVRVILNKSKVMVNNKIVKDPKLPVGIMDSVAIPSTNEYYRVLIGEDKKFRLNKISKENASLKLCRIKNKTIIHNNKLQINLSDGRNKLAENKELKVGDSVIFDLEKNEIKKCLKLEKGASVYLTGGKHEGVIATLDEIIISKDNKEDRIKIRNNKETFETLKEYALVIDKSLI